MAGLAALPFGIKAALAGVAVAAAATTAIVISNSGSEPQDAPVNPGDQPAIKADAPVLPTGNSTDDERRRFKIIDWKITKVFNDVADARELSLKDEAETINKALTGATPETVDATKQMFAKHKFEHIEKIAKAKLLSPEATMMMARHRRELTNQALAAALAEFDKDGRFTCGALDSGNKDSGIASDVDQTIFLISKDPNKKASSDDINKFIHVFDAQFARITGKPPAWYGIECMNGADFYPDWATEVLISHFTAEADRVYIQKRLNPEAYRSPGQLKSQAEGRGYDSLQSQIKKLQALSDTKQAIESAKGSDDDAAKKLADAQAAIDALVRKSIKGANPDDYKLGSFADAEAVIAKIESSISFNSPWTEVTRDADGKLRVSQVQSPLGKVLPNKPEFARRFAFDGAWDNWIMYTAHPHNRTKYLIRSVAEGSGVVFGAVQILGSAANGKTLTPFEYDTIYGQGDLDSLRKFVDDTYKHLPEEVRRRYRKSMDIAAKVRLRHKGTPPFKTMTDRQIFLEYVTDFKVSPEEAKLYPPATLETLILERAQRQWENDAREVMIENLLITSDAPADLLHGRLTPEERTRLDTDPRLRVGGFEKLTAATLKQFEHAFIDLMSKEHAELRTLPADSPRRKALEASRTPDILDRILARFANDPELSKRLHAIADIAAEKRVALDRAIAKDQAFYRRFYRNMKGAIANAPDAIKERVQDEYGKWKAGEKSYTVKDGALRLTKEFGDRVEGRWLDFYHGLGFELNTWESENRPPSAELGKFDRKQAMANLVSGGNFDSALEVWRAYLEGGDAKAAAKVAFIEAVSNLPYVSDGLALFDFGTTGNVQGIVQLGAAYYVPGAGQAYLVCNIAKNVVWIGGYYVFQPLKDDIAEKTYQGYLDKKAGIISTGVKETQLAVRPSVLANVKNLRVIPYVEKDDDGNVIKDKDGNERINYAFAEYSFDEALELGWLESEDGKTLRDDYEWLRGKGILGGGQQYEKLLKDAKDFDRNPKLNFDAKRASIYFQYEKRAAAALKGQNIELRHADDAYPTVRAMFGRTLHDWLNGSGEFQGVVDGEVNLLIEGKIEQVKDTIIERMTRDFFWSGELVRHGKYSIESMIKGNIEKARDERMKQQAYQMLLAEMDGARRSIDAGAVAALHELVRDRVINYRASDPRVRIRPVVVKSIDDKKVEKATVEVQTSIVADPADFPRTAGGELNYEAAWETFKKAEDWVLRLTFSAKDAAGKPIGKPIVREIGAVEDIIDTGPLHVTGVRIDATNSNGLVITSDALAKLDAKKPDIGLEFKVYFSQSPTGPFTLRDFGGGVAFKTEPLEFTGRDNIGWRAANQFVISDIPGTDDPVVGKPFYYQVGMTPVVMDDFGQIKPAGEEVRSNTTRPGGGSIRVLPPPTNDEMIESNAFEVSLCYEDQVLEMHNAQIVVKAGDFVGHFFTPRKEGTKDFGQHLGWNHSRVRAFVPWQPQAQTITIDGSGGGLTATRTIRMIKDPQRAEVLRREHEQRLASHAAGLQGQIETNQNFLTAHQNQLKEIAADRAKYPPKTESEKINAEITDADLRFSGIFYYTLGIKRRLLEIEGEGARLRGEHKKAKQHYEQALEIWEQQYVAQKAYIDERITLRRRLYALEKIESSRKTLLENLDKEQKRNHEENEAWINQQRFDTAWSIADNAYWSGDGATYQKMMELRAACIERATKEKLSLATLGATRGGVRMAAAEGIALLTGNRGAAAALYTEGFNMALADTLDEQQRQFMKQRWETEPRPSWWP